MTGTVFVPAASADCVEPGTVTVNGQECVDLVVDIVEHPPGGHIPDLVARAVWAAECIVIEQLGGTCPPPPA